MDFKELEEDKENFILLIKELKDIFDSAKIHYWLSFGTLLGAIREGKFIKWDNDMDFGAKLSEVRKVFSIIPQLAKKGWRIDVTDSTVSMSKEGVGVDIGFYRITNDKAWILFLKKNPKLNFILKYIDRIAEKAHYRYFHEGLPWLEVLIYRLIPSFLDRLARKVFFGIYHLFGGYDYAMVLPKSAIENFKTIKFYGMEFLVPEPPEEYLRLIYGDDWRTPNPNWKWEDVKAMDYYFFNNSKRADYSLI